MNVTLYLTWSFMFFVLGFQSKWLDHFLSLSASQGEQLLLFCLQVAHNP